MSPIVTSAVLGFVGVAIAYAAGVVGGFWGALFLIGASVFITVAGLVVGSDAYDRGWQDRDEMEGDIYD